MRRRSHDEPETHDRWLVSYADFITLLFAFFVVMYAISSVNEGKMRVLSDSLVANFSTRPKSLNPIQVGEPSRSSSRSIAPAIQPLRHRATSDAALLDPSEATVPSARADGGPAAGGEAGEVREARIAGVDAIADGVEQAVGSLIDDDLVYVRRKDRWVEVEFKTSLLFGSGDARLSAAAVPVLRELAVVLQGFSNPIQVEGFTDDVPISTATFPSNWELSAARAASVVHLFSRRGVKPQRMAAVGYGEYRPIADNDTAEGRNRNRRVVLVIPGADLPRHELELRRAMGESSASGLNTVEPWAEAPANDLGSR